MQLQNKRIANLVHNDFEDLELWYPVLRCREEGATVILAGEKANERYTGKYGIPAESDIAYTDLKGEELDGILIPGGWAPDKLRRFPEVINIVREMNDQNKPIGQICHAGWVVASANIIKGKNVTSTPGIKDDMENAGAIWHDKSVVVDGNLVSSRRPPDLPDYMRAFIELVASS